MNTILDNKPTIKILKEYIENINNTYSRNIKLSGTKDILIERIKKELMWFIPQILILNTKPRKIKSKKPWLRSNKT